MTTSQQNWRDLMVGDTLFYPREGSEPISATRARAQNAAHKAWRKYGHNYSLTDTPDGVIVMPLT